MSRVRVFIACSLDGFIAGPGNDLSWLPQPNGPDESDFGYSAFMKDIGALLMGRATYEVVAGFPGEWPYGKTPVLVATHRSLSPKVATVRALTGDVRELVTAAKEAAGGKDVYLDGGNLIRQALDAGLIDELTVTFVPIVLGAGHPLFAGVARRHPLELVSSQPIGLGMVQSTYCTGAQRAVA
ncbi:MAG: dihydrofolate reductase family protein [Myxococcota bacterium]